MAAAVEPSDVLLSGLGSKLRVVRRAREVSRVLIHHGLADLVSRFDLPGSRRVSPRKSSGESETEIAAGAPETTPERLRAVFEELGPTFVKLGQFLSTRHDLLPDDWTREFARLQEAVRPVAWSAIQNELRHCLGKRLETEFQSIDANVLAAGSVAQIHRATLSDGSQVVLKVLRPGIGEVIQSDLEVLALLASLSARHVNNLGVDPVDLLQEFAQDRMTELDLLHEGRATDRLRRLVGDDPNVVFPRVYWHVSTPSVLVLEFLAGTTVSKLDADSLTPEAAHAFVARGCRAVVRQCLDYGFFHADPHPGNLLYMPGDRVGFIDCGITGYLGQDQRRLLVDLVTHILEGDAEACQLTAIDLTGADPALEEDRPLRRSIQDFLVDFDHATLEQLDITRLLTRLYVVLRRHGMVLHGDLVKLLKALTAVEAVANNILPGFHLSEEVARSLTALASRRLSLESLTRRMAASVSAYSTLLEHLPRDLSRLLNQIRHRQFDVRLSHGGLGRLTAAILFASRLLAGAVVVASLLVAGSILLHAGDTLGGPGRWLGFASLGIASAIGVFMAARHFRYRGGGEDE